MRQTESADLPTLPALVVGRVTHWRYGRVRHAFRHPVHRWLVKQVGGGGTAWSND